MCNRWGCEPGDVVCGGSETLWRWHEEDPPGADERLHNYLVFKMQHNSNPFISNATDAEELLGEMYPVDVLQLVRDGREAALWRVAQQFVQRAWSHARGRRVSHGLDVADLQQRRDVGTAKRRARRQRAEGQREQRQQHGRGGEGHALAGTAFRIAVHALIVLLRDVQCQYRVVWVRKRARTQEHRLVGVDGRRERRGRRPRHGEHAEQVRRGRPDGVELDLDVAEGWIEVRDSLVHPRVAWRGAQEEHADAAHDTWNYLLVSGVGPLLLPPADTAPDLGLHIHGAGAARARGLLRGTLHGRVVHAREHTRVAQLGVQFRPIRASKLPVLGGTCIGLEKTRLVTRAHRVGGTRSVARTQGMVSVGRTLSIGRTQRVAHALAVGGVGGVHGLRLQRVTRIEGGPETGPVWGGLVSAPVRRQL
eukprot:3934575-Rhodomonas_salina.1